MEKAMVIEKTVDIFRVKGDNLRQAELEMLTRLEGLRKEGWQLVGYATLKEGDLYLLSALIQK